ATRQMGKYPPPCSKLARVALDGANVFVSCRNPASATRLLIRPPIKERPESRPVLCGVSNLEHEASSTRVLPSSCCLWRYDSSRSTYNCTALQASWAANGCQRPAVGRGCRGAAGRYLALMQHGGRVRVLWSTCRRPLGSG